MSSVTNLKKKLSNPSQLERNVPISVKKFALILNLYNWMWFEATERFKVLPTPTTYLWSKSTNEKRIRLTCQHCKQSSMMLYRGSTVHCCAIKKSSLASWKSPNLEWAIALLVRIWWRNKTWTDTYRRITWLFIYMCSLWSLELLYCKSSKGLEPLRKGEKNSPTSPPPPPTPTEILQLSVTLF